MFVTTTEMFVSNPVVLSQVRNVADTKANVLTTVEAMATKAVTVTTVHVTVVALTKAMETAIEAQVLANAADLTTVRNALQREGIHQTRVVSVKTIFQEKNAQENNFSLV
jgi:hypothetical protein